MSRKVSWPSCPTNGDTLASWAASNLLWQEFKGKSDQQKARRLLQSIAAFTAFPSTKTFWRGHSCHGYRLIPAAARAAGTTQESLSARTATLIARAKEASLSWREGDRFRQLSELDMLAYLQHREVPTALLDLTPDPMVALWFATRRPLHADSGADCDGVLFGFNVDGKWEDLSGSRDSYEAVITRLTKLKKLGWFRPPWSDDRMAVQRSRLLVADILPAGSKAWAAAMSAVRVPSPTPGHLGADSQEAQRRLKQVFDPGVGKPPKIPVLVFRIPKALKATLGAILDTQYGISGDTVFPDARGVMGGVDA